jgi:death-on-curing family protein
VKRRVRHLAVLAALPPEEALARLVRAGLPVSSVENLVAVNRYQEALSLLGISVPPPRGRYEAQITYPAPTPGHVGRGPLGPDTVAAGARSALLAAVAAPKISTQKHKGLAATLFLEEADVLDLHDVLVKLFATFNDPISPSGARDRNLLGSALGRPRTALGDSEKYRTLSHKAAALFHSLVKNHPFHNGNKRTALVATLVFLERNGWRLRTEVPDDALFGFVTEVAGNCFPHPGHGLDSDALVDAMAEWLRPRFTSRPSEPSDMSLRDFLDCCRSAKAQVQERSSSWLVRGPNGASRTIQKSARRLAGKVIKSYASALGLAGSLVGRSFDQFQEGLSPEQQLIDRLMTVLRRLASYDRATGQQSDGADRRAHGASG